MKKIDSQKGISGLLRPFRQFISDAGLNKGDQVIYFGCPGTCTPFIELLAYAVRDMGLEHLYVPMLDTGSAKKLELVDGVGYQVKGKPETVSPKVVVIMGGLSMPGVPVTADEALDAVNRTAPDAKLAGVSFMNMFQKAGWTEKLSFDFMIDAILEPVDIWA